MSCRTSATPFDRLYLSSAESAHNIAVHSSTGFSPIEVVRGVLPPDTRVLQASSHQLDEVDVRLLGKDKVVRVARCLGSISKVGETKSIK